MRTFKSLEDRILASRLERKEATNGGIGISDTAKGKPREGKVIAAGPGNVTDDGKLQPVPVEKEARTMAGKKFLHNEEARRATQRGVSRRANAEKAALHHTERDIARDKQFDALSVPKGGRTVRKRPTGPPRHWPSPSSTKGGRT